MSDSSLPPYTLTPLILKRCQQIAHELGILEGAKVSAVPLKLRRDHQIRTIQSTLAIEGNSLTIEQVTGILDGKRVIGPKKDMLEVNNAIKIYADLDKWDPLSMSSFKQAHKVLMNKLIEDNGKWREKGVGIFKGKAVAHVAPPAGRVSTLMEGLFQFLNEHQDISWLIKASIFHYELEFIHPFTDGNGRMGRLWQQLLFMKENQIFKYISVESIIKRNQKEYYDCLAKCDKAGNSTEFIEFSLEQAFVALKGYSDLSLSKAMDIETRLQYAKEKLQYGWFSRKDYLALHKDISTATASRDLEKGVSLNILTKVGSKNLTRYCFRNI